MPEHRLSSDEAIALGKMLGYELALVGHIVELETKLGERKWPDVEIEVRVIAVQNGKVLARIVAPGTGFDISDENYNARRAIERANERLLRLEPELILD